MDRGTKKRVGMLEQVGEEGHVADWIGLNGWLVDLGRFEILVLGESSLYNEGWLNCQFLKSGILTQNTCVLGIEPSLVGAHACIHRSPIIQEARIMQRCLS